MLFALAFGVDTVGFNTLAYQIILDGRGAALSTLEVRRSNAAALALYGDLGYRQVGVRPNYYAEEGEDAIVMVRDLGIG